MTLACARCQATSGCGCRGKSPAGFLFAAGLAGATAGSYVLFRSGKKRPYGDAALAAGLVFLVATIAGAATQSG